MDFRLDTTYGRLMAWLNMHLVDHGCIRAVYSNLYGLGGGMYRSSQPSPAQIRNYQSRLGLKSILNLRGVNEFGSYALEEETCNTLGIRLETFRLYSRQPPTRAEIHGIKAVFASLEYPALLHCKSGADRAGIGAALFRILHLGHDVRDALTELNWRYGHFRRSQAGVLEFVLETYLARNVRAPIGFMEWVDSEYDPGALEKQYIAEGWASLLNDTLLQRE
jgi:protein tyrosine/serine phosphatase